MDLKRETLARAGKTAFGCTMAIFLANLAGLTNVTSAGIITLLTMQNTRKDTVRHAVYRFFSFALALILAVAFGETLGYHALGFGVFLFFLVEICYLLGWEDMISTNTVFASHVFMLARVITPAFVVNELVLLILGTGMAVLLDIRRGPGVSQSG